MPVAGWRRSSRSRAECIVSGTHNLGGRGSDGSYVMPEGLVAGFPVVSHGGHCEIVSGLLIDEFSRQRFDRLVAEPAEERELIVASGLFPAR